jgi:hypothetical protein
MFFSSKNYFYFSSLSKGHAGTGIEQLPEEHERLVLQENLVPISFKIWGLYLIALYRKKNNICVGGARKTSFK